LLVLNVGNQEWGNQMIVKMDSYGLDLTTIMPFPSIPIHSHPFPTPLAALAAPQASQSHPQEDLQKTWTLIHQRQPIQDAAAQKELEVP